MRQEETCNVALSASVIPLEEMPGYYLHVYELPFIESENDVLKISSDDSHLRTISTDQSSLQSSDEYAYQAVQGSLDYTPVFGSERCVKDANFK